MPPVGFEPTISAGERLQTHALDGAANGTGCHFYYAFNLHNAYFQTAANQHSEFIILTLRRLEADPCRLAV